MRYATSRLVRGAALVLLAVTSACSDSAPTMPSGSATGQLNLRLKDAPGDVKTAVVTISQIYLQGTDGGRVVLRSDPFTTDLRQLTDTSAVVLQDVQLKAGSYSQLRFVISGAYIEIDNGDGTSTVYASSPAYAGLPQGVTPDGQLQMPSLGTSGLKVNLPGDQFMVPEDGVVSVLVDFDVSQSFGHVAGNSGKWVMHPVVNATSVEFGTGFVATLQLGTGVTLPVINNQQLTLADFTLTLESTANPGVVIKSAPFTGPAADGSFRASLGFVSAGSYLVNIVAPAGLTTFTTDPAVPFAYTASAGPASVVAFTVTAAN
jgi:hypothetical protein